MKKKQKPFEIGAGCTLGLAMPSGPTKRHTYEQAVDNLKTLGFKTTTARKFKEYPGFFAGSIRERVGELHTLFVDPEVDGILCLRGGYGSASLLPYLDFSLISRHRKLFIGYSDITALHIALYQEANLLTLHAPMAASDLIEAPAFTVSHFTGALRANRWPGTITNPPTHPIKTISHGTAEGELVGGNLAVLTSLMGTPYELDTKGKILFFEDVGEEPYAIDRMLTQLALAGKLDDANGFILGTCEKCESEDYPNGDTVLQVCERILAPYQKPTIYNVQAGHGSPQLTLPLGARTRIDATNGTINILEQAVIKR